MGNPELLAKNNWDLPPSGGISFHQASGITQASTGMSASVVYSLAWTNIYSHILARHMIHTETLDRIIFYLPQCAYTNSNGKMNDTTMLL